MESCKLEIIIHSVKGLTDFKHFGAMDPYVRVWLAGENEQSPIYRTRTAIKGASCPIWNFSAEFNIASIHKYYTLFCEIKHAGTFVDRDIGQVQVRLRDLLTGSDSGENVSYPVKTAFGEIVGKIILSHTISFGENVVDMKNIELKQKRKFVKSVIKEVAITVATGLTGVAMAAADIL